MLFNGPQGGVETELSGQIHDYETLMAAADDEYNWRVEGENQAMGLCYTSGTTGHPKGALYSHRSMYLHTVAACQAAAIGLTENDVVMPVVPQFHAMAWGLPYAAINVGADLVLPGAAHAAVGPGRADRNGAGDGGGRRADDLERSLSRPQAEPP